MKLLSARPIQVALVAVAVFAASCSSEAEEPGQATAAGAESSVSTSAPTSTASTTVAEAATDPDEPVTSTTTVEAGPRAAYSEDFEGGIGDEWSTIRIDETPSGTRKFLGEFSNGDVTLRLSDLPEHDEVWVEFDLLVIRSWDGFGSSDVWRLAVDGQDLIRTSFNLSVDEEQNYPRNLPFGRFPSRFEAAEDDTLGYFFREESNLADSVYTIRRNFEHSSDTLELTFAAAGLQDIRDESWGIDNLEVKTSLTERDNERAVAAVRFEVDAERAIRISGTVPSRDDKELLIEAADGFSAEVIDVSVDDTALYPMWLARVGEIPQSLTRRTPLVIEIGSDATVLSGEVTTEEYADQVARKVGDIDTRTVDNRLTWLVDKDATDAIAATIVEGYGSGSAAIPAGADEVLDLIVRLAGENPAVRIQVHGHTDVAGKADNGQLALDRATLVYDELVERGIDPAMVHAVSRSHWDGRADNETEEGRALNRRVTFVVELF